MTQEEDVVDNYYQMNFGRFIHRNRISDETEEEKFWRENMGDEE
jgi:hypothetical protein